jgi:hypothetical protein
MRVSAPPHAALLPQLDSPLSPCAPRVGARFVFGGQPAAPPACAFLSAAPALFAPPAAPLAAPGAPPAPPPALAPPAPPHEPMPGAAAVCPSALSGGRSPLR